MRYIIAATFMILTVVGTLVVVIGVVVNGLSLYLAISKTNFNFCFYQSMKVTGEALQTIALERLMKAEP